MDKAPKLRKLAEITKNNPMERPSVDGMDTRPTFNISEIQLPELTSWKVGEKYSLEMEVEMISVRKEDYGMDKGNICGQFKITKIGADNEDNEENEEEYKKGGVVKKAPKKK